MMTDCFEQLAEEAGNLKRMSKRATLTAREVQVRFVAHKVQGWVGSKCPVLC